MAKDRCFCSLLGHCVRWEIDEKRMEDVVKMSSAQAKARESR